EHYCTGQGLRIKRGTSSGLYLSRALQCLPKRGLQKAASPVPEREAAYLGDAIAGPRTLHFSQPPQAAKGRSGKL
ncbi:MAG: hypothetical protein ACXWPG_13245, partial [Ktedonobacteraceae bacterium]